MHIPFMKLVKSTYMIEHWATKRSDKHLQDLIDVLEEYQLLLELIFGIYPFLIDRLK
jgi:hypothetical protein